MFLHRRKCNLFQTDSIVESVFFIVKMGEHNKASMLKEETMKIILLSIFTGFLVGFIFAFMKLPIPAPPALAGVTGIVGIYLGFKVFEVITPWLQNIVK